MREAELTKLSLLLAFVGLGLLALASHLIEAERVAISDLTIDDLNKRVKVCGTIAEKYVSRKGTVFLTLEERGSVIKVVFFNQTAQKLQRFKVNVYALEEGQKVCLRGRVSEYEGELEIIGERLEG